MKTSQVVSQKTNSLTVIDNEFLEEVLKPYHKHTSYLKKAFFQSNDDGNYKDYVIKGEFAIEESCYIDDTGHFNAVEFNICYNQITYAYLGYCIKNNLIPELDNFNIQTFFEKQLSNVLIVKFSSSFKSQINAKRFYGTYRFERVNRRSNCTFIETSCSFSDDEGGKSNGKVTLAILHP